MTPKLNKCNFCCSSRIRADRSMGGKLFCLDCGKPITIGRNILFNENNKGYSMRKTLPIIIIILLIIIILI